MALLKIGFHSFPLVVKSLYGQKKPIPMIEISSLENASGIFIYVPVPEISKKIAQFS